ncbi:MAG: hypothetical protein ACYS22_02995 [Planctomycetota bacterium]|jgi:hypothetical protein
MLKARIHLLILALVALAATSPALAQTTVPGLHKGDEFQPIDASAFRLVDGNEWAQRGAQAYVAAQSKMQGGPAWRGRFYVSCSSQKKFWFWSRNYGKLYRLTPGSSKGYNWAYGPEDLTYSPRSGNLWSLSEHPGTRAVFAVKPAR